ncbi:unnamed protein product [Somion occarium]|uniref:Uncharacterized protein n=1 Tax=Somion occarium TaxID=3059160 RepID=A0ABP1CID5_9APHY
MDFEGLASGGRVASGELGLGGTRSGDLKGFLLLRMPILPGVPKASGFPKSGPAGLGLRGVLLGFPLLQQCAYIPGATHVLELAAEGSRRVLPVVKPKNPDPLGVLDGAIPRANVVLPAIFNSLADWNPVAVGGTVLRWNHPTSSSADRKALALVKFTASAETSVDWNQAARSCSGGGSG